MNRFMLVVSSSRWLLALMFVGLQVTFAGADTADETPLAFDGGPYAGTAGIAVTFDGTASFDADGDPLTYAWDFGDGSPVGSGAVTTHVYATANTYVVRLTVTANGLSNSDETQAVIGNLLGARAFTLQQEVSKLSNPKPASVRIESGGGFMLWDVNPTQVWMRRVGTTDAIRAIPSSVVTDGDRDRNGQAELKASFAKTDLRLLFGSSTGPVPVRIQGQLRTGPWFSADLDFPVSGAATAIQATLVNNPVQGTAVLELSAAGSADARVDVFDVRGRMLRSVSGAGAERRRFDLAGAVRQGGAASGVYFYRVTDADGSRSGRFVLLH